MRWGAYFLLSGISWCSVIRHEVGRLSKCASCTRAVNAGNAKVGVC